MQKLNADLKAKTFEKIYLFFGAESYLCRAYKNRFRSAIVPADDDMNYSYFENAADKLNEIEDIADTMPFFADRRLIVLENSGLFKKENGFAEYLQNMPDSTTIILVDYEVDKRTKLYKDIAKLGYACEFKKQSIPELKIFVARWLDKAGKHCTDGVADLFVNMVGDDMNLLVNEADKVIAYSGERDFITEEDIRAVCIPQVENKVFDMVEALISHDKTKAFSLYADLMALRESPFGILALVRKNYTRLLSVKELIDKNTGISEICSRIKTQEWLVKKMKSQLRGYSADKLAKAIEETVNTEYAIKSGDMGEQLGFEILLAKLLSL